MPDKERDIVAEANNDFSLNLYPLLLRGEENLFFSPLSIFTALAMAYAGAKNLTESQMADVLNFNTDQEALHPLIKNLTDDLTDSKSAEINIANALWVQMGYKLLNKYMFTINRNYNGSAYEIDFTNASDACAKVNSWVSEQTRDKIPNIINESMIKGDLRVILMNAIYFKCKWAKVFQELDTQDDDFTLISGEKILVRMMYQKEYYYYIEEEDFRAINISYEAARFNMLVFLARKMDGIIELEKNLRNIKLEDIYPRFEFDKIELYLPKFKFETKYELQDYLKAMGMANVFTNTADFSGMTDHPEGLKFDVVIHKTFLEVNETGTEAAAATMMGLMAGGPPPPPEQPLEFRVDHPFIFMIYDSRTKSVLFMGRVMNPLK